MRFLGLIDLGSCNIHTMHNAFVKGIERYGKDIYLLYLYFYSLLKHNSARYEDLKEVQKEMEVELHNFLQHSEKQWLSAGPKIKRILEQLEAIIQSVAEVAKGPKKGKKEYQL